VKKIKMNKLISILFLSILFQMNGISQILIGGKAGNIVYSSVVNQIKYIGNYNCDKLKVKIEGYDEEMKFKNCNLEITYLKLDTSRLEIKDEVGETIFDTILIKNRNDAKGYIQIGERLLITGKINKKDLQLLDQIKVKYACPWLREPKVYGFKLIIVNDKREYLSFDIIGNKILDIYKDEILLMKNPLRIYIEQINWVPINCFEKINSIVLEIK
jgi:hypothetical protein